MGGMMKSIRTTLMRPDTIALSFAAIIVVVAIIAATSAEAIAAQSPGQPIAVAESTSARGIEVMLPFLIVTGVVMLAGVAVVAGRRLAK